MRARSALLIFGLTALPLASAVAAAGDDPRSRLAAARAASAAAAARADLLERRADAEGNAAAKAATEAAAAAARVEGAEADLAAGRARLSAVRQLLSGQRATLARQQGPVIRLLGAIEAMARRPAVLSLIQPGSIDDLVHVRAVLSGAMPVIAARTAGLRVQLDRSRRLEAEASVAAAALAEGRQRLEAQRLASARAEAIHRGRQSGLGRAALAQSDRALAMGEHARDLVDLLDQSSDAAATERGLAALAAPAEHRAGATVPLWGSEDAPYRLPVSGVVVSGFGELSDAGVRSRGLTIATTGGASVIAPAAGRIAFAGHFRDYGMIVIVDHGGGWTTLLAGLASVRVDPGALVVAGQPLGRAPGEDARITVELRRGDRPVDFVPLLG